MSNPLSLSDGLLRKLQAQADEKNTTIESLLEDWLSLTAKPEKSLYEHMVHGAEDAIFVTTPQGKFLEVNNAALELIGYNREELDQLLSTQIYANPRIRDEMLTILDTIGIKDYPVDFKRKDGSVVHVAVTAQRLFDDDGQFMGLLSIVRNRHEKKIIEDTLYFIAKESITLDGEALYQALAKYLGTVLKVDYAFVGLYEPERGVIRTLALCEHGKIINNLEYDVHGTPCYDALDTERLVTCPYAMQQLYPEDFVAIEMNLESYIGMPLLSSTGEPVGILSVMDREPLENTYLAETLIQIATERAAREVEREHARHTLMMSDYRFRTVIDNMPASIFIKDKDGIYMDVNKTMLQRFGLTYDRVVGHSVTEIFPNSFGDRMNNLDQKVIQTGKPITVEHDVVINGKAYIDYLHKFPLFDVDGQPYAVCGIALDVTEQKEAEQARLEAQALRVELEKEKKLKDYRKVLFSMISHDIKNPLSSIKLSTELLQNYSDKMQAEARNLRFESVYYHIQQISMLLDDILIIGEVESGKLPFKPESSDVLLFCRQVLQANSGFVTRKHKLKHQIPDGSLKMVFDPHLLTRAIGNLLSNAVKYSPEGTTITFVVKIDDEQVTLCVKDEGIGIPDGEQQHLFETFFRASNAEKQSKGTGLGLAVVKYATDVHQGEVRVESAINRGSLFSITIPIVRSHEMVSTIT